MMYSIEILAAFDFLPREITIVHAHAHELFSAPVEVAVQQLPFAPTSEMDVPSRSPSVGMNAIPAAAMLAA